MLKTFVQSIPPLYEALAGTRSDLLNMIRENCRPQKIDPTLHLINEVINKDVSYQKTPLDLRNQRTYAVKVILNPMCYWGATDLISVRRQWTSGCS